MAAIHDRYVNVDGIRVHYLEGGDGPQTVVLFHGAEYSGCATLGWEHNLGPLSDHFRVIAPDWLGYGYTDKIFDFANGAARRTQVQARLLQILDVKDADFIGNSYGAGMILNAASSPNPIFPIRRIVAVSGGGGNPDTEGRRALQSYDGSRDSMKRVMWGLFSNPKYYETDDAYIDRRQAMGSVPGHWESLSAARFHSPAASQSAPPPQGAPYENIKVPVLLIGGRQDKLLNPTWAEDLQARIPHAEKLVFEDCGHCSQIEYPEQWNAAVIEFLSKPVASVNGVAAATTAR